VKNLIESTVEETKAVLEEPLKETEAALKKAQIKEDKNGSNGAGEEAGDGNYSDWLPKK
jgi:hypothetical protein